jgi:hypothetical protein
LEGDTVTTDIPEGSEESTAHFLWEVHRYTNEYIRFADTKAAFIAGVSTALIGSLVSSTLLDTVLLTSPSLWSKLQWTAIVALILLAASLAFCISVIKPRLWNNRSVGFIYWGSVIGHGTTRDFTKAVHALSVRERSVSISDHLFVLAAIADRKYRYADRAVIAAVAGGTLTGIALFLQHATRT